MTKEHEEKVENEKRDEIEGEFNTGRGGIQFSLPSEVDTFGLFK